MGRLTHRTMPGLSYFATTKTWQNREIFRVDENADIVVECILRYRDDGAFQIHEFVVMPNHLHLLLTPSASTSLEKAMQLIKGGSSHQIHKLRGHKMHIWQPGFHEESVRDCNDFAAKATYICMNPVRARLAEQPEQWPHGSAFGRFQLDAAPVRLKLLSSGAKALVLESGGMSELKLRPPKRPGPQQETPEQQEGSAAPLKAVSSGAKAVQEEQRIVGAKAPTP